MAPGNGYQLRQYRRDNGRVPFHDWLHTLEVKTRARVRARLARVRDGHLGDHRSLGQGLWELRDFSGPGYRIYFTRSSRRIIVLLAGGDKDSQERDITRAREYLEDWRQRHDEEGESEPHR